MIKVKKSDNFLGPQLDAEETLFGQNRLRFACTKTMVIFAFVTNKFNVCYQWDSRGLTIDICNMTEQPVTVCGEVLAPKQTILLKE
jgi:predicted RNA-binding protein associated with RNAse of E/G family